MTPPAPIFKSIIANDEDPEAMIAFRVIDPDDEEEEQRRAQSRVSVQSYEATKGKTQEWAMWRSHTSETRTKFGMSRTSAPWTSNPNVHLKGVPDSTRIHDLIDVGFVVQVSQSDHCATTHELADGL